MTSPQSSPAAASADWRIYRCQSQPHGNISALPAPPSWRVFDGGPGLDLPSQRRDEPAGLTIRARAYEAEERTINLVNAALYLRRPLLVTGKPGTGKSTLARSIAHELGLGPVLTWAVTSRSTLREALYQYDALGRFEDADASTGTDIGRYVTLGPLGTAMLPWKLPRVLLIDELDKSDIDLPNDLLHIFEEGSYDIPELARLPEEVPTAHVMTCEAQRVPVQRGHIRCLAFPVIVITSNGEREFPPPFLRRCIRVDLAPPREEALVRIVDALLGTGTAEDASDLISEFVQRREHADIATDQLLNAIYLVTSRANPTPAAREQLIAAILRELDSWSS